MSGYTYVWEFTVAPDHVAAFERAYGPDGDWAQLFRGAPGYRGTTLLRDRRDPRRYLTIDAWASETAWTAFRAAKADAFEALDRACEALTIEEREIGRFAAVE